MTSPSNVNNPSNWRYKQYVEQGRLEAIGAVLQLIADKKSYFETLAKGFGKPNDSIVFMLGQFFKEVHKLKPTKPEAPKLDWSGVDKDKEVDTLRILIEDEEKDK